MKIEITASFNEKIDFDKFLEQVKDVATSWSAPMELELKISVSKREKCVK